MKEHSASINQGSQAMRGQLNSMHSILSVIDSDYRQCLYNNNHLHTKILGTVENKYYLPPHKFSF